MITSIFATLVALVFIYVGVKFINAQLILTKYGGGGKDFIVYFPKWYTLLASVKTFDSRDYISKEHVEYKVKSGMDRDEAELEEWLVVLEMELPKHEDNFITTYCIIKNGEVVLIKPLEEYYNYLVGYLKGYRIYKQISEEINDED